MTERSETRPSLKLLSALISKGNYPPMRRQELLIKSSGLLARFAYDVRVKNSMGLFDINTIAEDLLVPVFSVVFDCPNLQNQNKIQMNFPAVDLGCSKKQSFAANYFRRLEWKGSEDGGEV